jgi:hypothetical protein
LGRGRAGQRLHGLPAASLNLFRSSTPTWRQLTGYRLGRRRGCRR